MFAGAADTHTALWFLFGDLRLPVQAKAFIEESATRRLKIALASISLAEIVYLAEKQRIPASAFADIVTAIRNPAHVFEAAPLTVEVVAAMQRMPREAVLDMPDRIIAATALFFWCTCSQPGRAGQSLLRKYALVVLRAIRWRASSHPNSYFPLADIS